MGEGISLSEKIVVHSHSPPLFSVEYEGNHNTCLYFFSAPKARIFPTGSFQLDTEDQSGNLLHTALVNSLIGESQHRK